jgi:hypothetical protein
MNVPFSELKKPHKPFKCAFYYPPIPDGFVGELPEGVGQLYYKIVSVNKSTSLPAMIA